jgi:hypothetical protein
VGRRRNLAEGRWCRDLRMRRKGPWDAQKVYVVELRRALWSITEGTVAGRRHAADVGILSLKYGRAEGRIHVACQRRGAESLWRRCELCTAARRVQGNSAVCSRGGLGHCWTEKARALQTRDAGSGQRPFTVHVQTAYPYWRARANIIAQGINRAL